MPDGRLTKIKSINRLKKRGSEKNGDEKNGGDCYSKTEQTVTVLMAQNYNNSKDIS